MLEIFSMISGIDISYKTVERLYSDELVMMALYNLHVLLLKKKGIKESDATGDGIGYSLTVKKNHMRRNLRTKPRKTEMIIMASNQQKSEKHLLILLGLWTLGLRCT